MTGVDVRGVVKAYGDVSVLAGVDLAIPDGSLTAVLGPSGCGKTTLLRIIAGFENADAGSVAAGTTTLEGPGRHVPPEERNIGYVPQEGALFPHLDVAGNVGFGLRDRGAAKARRVDELLELVGLPGLGRRQPHELSGGQQQRVALARALAPTPRVVLLDEPFSSLDTALRASVREDVQAILRHEQTTAILVTHDQDEALSLADVIAILGKGRIVQAGTPKELYDAPVDAEVASFVGIANLLPGVVVGGRAETAFGSLALDPSTLALAGAADGARTTVLVRPEQVFIDAGPGGTGSPERPAIVERFDYHGHDAEVRMRLLDVPDLDGAWAREVVARTAADRVLRSGDRVMVHVHGTVRVCPRREDRPAG